MVFMAADGNHMDTQRAVSTDWGITFLAESVDHPQ
jgi:hypothetical protein